MTTATKTKQRTVAPPEPAPQREWQVGDRITGVDPQGKPFQGAVIGVGLTYLKCHNHPTRMTDAVLVTPADAVVVPPAPFQAGDVLHHKGQEWQVKTIQQLDWMGWHVDLLEADALPGDWSVDWIEWAVDEPCPATPLAVAGQPDGTVAIVPPAAVATHTPGFLSPNLANRLLEFSQGLDWQQNQFRIYGKEMPLPRMEIMFGDPGCTYRYGNVTLSPLPWPPELQALREQVEDATGHSYQVVIGNLYRSGADHIGWHSDDSPEMGENPAIASISLGATRRFNVRDETTREVTNYNLESGDLVFMPAGFQSTHKHRLAKTAKPVDLRINWTFRPHVGGAAPAAVAEIVAADPGDRLAELEADITEGLGLIEQGKAKIWAAVAAVRSEELWRVGGHPSFEAYCADRWNWKKANGHENALAGEVLTELLASGVPVEAVPTSTSAMSQLAKAPAGDRAAVLQTAADLNGGKVTEAAVRQALKPEPTAEDELRSAGIPVYRPDTSPEAIALGLETGYLRPTTEHRPSPADFAHTAAPEAEDIQPSAKHHAPVLGDSGGGSAYAIGQAVKIEGEPLAAWVVATHLNEGGLMLWGSSGKRVVESRDVCPLGDDSHPASLNYPAKAWLAEMVRVLGPKQVQALLGEVVS